jgi:hypothetical protein
MLVLSAAAVRSKPLSGALLMTGARRFALTGLYQAGIAGTAIELASGWIVTSACTAPGTGKPAIAQPRS